MAGIVRNSVDNLFQLITKADMAGEVAVLTRRDLQSLRKIATDLDYIANHFDPLIREMEFHPYEDQQT